MKQCKHIWSRRSDNWTVFRCTKCGILGYFMKQGSSFKIIPYICQKAKCGKFATKINGLHERYCDEHYIEKEPKEWSDYAAREGNIRHTPIDPEIYYEKAK